MKTNHKIMAVLLAALILLVFASGCLADDTDATGFTSTTFSDVTPSSWFYTGVRDAYQVGLMEGVGNSHFKPDSNFTVAQAIAVAARMYALYNKDSISTGTGGKWYEPYIAYAAKHGLLNDALKNTANPDTVNATRAQAAFLFYGVLSKAETSPQYINTSTIPDLNQFPADYTDAVSKMFKLGIFTGMANGNFAGNDDVTRAQIAVIISRILDPSYRIPYDSKYNNELAGQEGNLFMYNGVVVWDDDYTYFVVANDDGSRKCHIVKRNNTTMKAQIIYAGNGKISNLRLKDGCLYFIEALEYSKPNGEYTSWYPSYSYLVRFDLARNAASSLYKTTYACYLYSFELYGDDIYICTQGDTGYDKIMVLHNGGSWEDLVSFSNMFLEGREIAIYNNVLYYVSAWFDYDTMESKSYLMAVDLNTKDGLTQFAEGIDCRFVSVAGGILYVMDDGKIYRMNLITDSDYEQDKELLFDSTGKISGYINYSVIKGNLYIGGENFNSIYKVLGDGSLSSVKDAGIPPRNFIVTGNGEYFYIQYLAPNFPFYYASGYQYSNGIADYLGVGDFDTSHAVKSVATGE